MLCVTLTIRRIIEHIVYSNLLVSLSCGVLTAGFSYSIPTEEWLIYGIIAFLTTFAIYNFQRIVKSTDSKVASKHMLWVEKHRTLIILAIILFSILDGLLLLMIINWSLNTVLLGAIGLLISFFYIVRIGKSNLRELPFIKIHLITISWVYMVAILPLLNEHIATTGLWVFAFLHYLYIIAVTIPFDIRDMHYDAANQQTIPQLFGSKNAKIIAGFCLLTFYLGSILLESDLKANLLFLLANLIQMVLIIRTRENQSEFYASGWIEGSILLLGLAYFI